MSPADIILFAVNARYAHSSFGARCLLANLGPRRPRAKLLEYDLRKTPEEIAEDILAASPRIAAAGVYIWNHATVQRTMEIIRERNPEIIIVVGGPELIAAKECPAWADYLITGEADLEFARLCGTLLKDPCGLVPQVNEVTSIRGPQQDLLHPRRKVAGVEDPRIIRAEPPDTANLASPYEEYTDDDIRNRIIYVEASRGCPYRCEYCISSLDNRMRNFPQAEFFREMEHLLARGARQFKFADRAFNADIRSACEILDFFQTKNTPSLRLHFEMMPDRFPDELKKRILSFPAGALHLEIGIQTFNEDAAARIMRKTDFAKAEENLKWLREETKAEIHADLIAGLPGETFESIAAGFDRLVNLWPHELQFGILKKLPGAPIARHDAEWKMIYNDEPPYDILENNCLSRNQVQSLKQFARFWDLFYNRGNFPRFMRMLLDGTESPFAVFAKFSDWLAARFGRAFGIPQLDLYAAALEYLKEKPGIGSALLEDFSAGGRRGHIPRFLKEAVSKHRE
ncbi:MAG: DUF4080 domain-containing protein [Kiritimatiellia bacterium]